MARAVAAALAGLTITRVASITLLTGAYSIFPADSMTIAPPTNALARQSIAQVAREALFADASAVLACCQVAFVAVHARPVLAGFSSKRRLADTLTGDVAITVAGAVKRTLLCVAEGAGPPSVAQAHRAGIIALAMPAALTHGDATVGPLEARAAKACGTRRLSGAVRAAHSVGERATVGAETVTADCPFPAS